MKRVPEVMENVRILLKNGNSFFWFDRWLASSPLSARINDVTNKQIRIRDCWMDQAWNVELLKELVAEAITEEIVQTKISGSNGLDSCVWKPTSDGKFTTATARDKMNQLSWHD